MAKTEKYIAPKYPRVMVSEKRHAQLAKEARRQKISIAELAEQIFKKACGGK